MIHIKLQSFVGWIRRVFCVVIHRSSVDYDAESASNPPYKIPKKSHGFTLLEILVAVFIFAIVSAMMVTSLHTIITAQSATEKNAARFAEIQYTLILMSRDFEQVIDRPILNAVNAKENAFIGHPDSVTMTHMGLANPLWQLQRSTLQRTRYRLDKNNLLRDSWEPLDQTSKSLPVARTLLHNVSELRFEYLDAQNKFVAHWPPSSGGTQVKFPKAVRVTIELKDLGKITQLYVIPSQIMEIPAPKQGQLTN